MARPDLYDKARDDPGSLTKDELAYLQDRDIVPEGYEPLTQEDRGSETEIVATAVGSSVVPKDNVDQFTNPEGANVGEGTVDSDEDDEDVEQVESYSDLSVEELKGELEARNLSTSGKKDTLVARLEADDDSKATAES